MCVSDIFTIYITALQCNAEDSAVGELFEITPK